MRMIKPLRRVVLFVLVLGMGFLAGWYVHARFAPDPGPGSEREPESSLKGLGYLSAYEEAPEESGLLVHDERAHESLILWTSAHDFDVYLMRPDGEILHRWPISFFDIWPEAPKPHPQFDAGAPKFSRFAVEPDGDLYVVFSPYGIVKVDPDGRILWSRLDINHHDVVIEGKKIYSLTQDYKRISIRGYEENRRTDFITAYSPDGEVLDRHDLHELIVRSGRKGLLDDLPVDSSEVFHSNSLEPLGENRFLVSVRKLNAVLDMDFSADTIPWSLVNKTSKQHAAHRVGDDVLLFDNGVRFVSSRVVQFDRTTGEIEWQYGRGLGGSFYSRCCGAVERLDNGNTFFVDSESGRMIEVTPDRETVWEFINPHVTGEGKVPTVPEADRLERSFFEPEFLRQIGEPTTREP